MKHFLAGLCLVPVFVIAAFGATAEDEIKAAEKSWAGAVRARDFTALEKIYSPELIYAHASGNIETKQKYMDRLRSGAQRYNSITQENITIAVHGESAVAHSIMRMTGVNDAGPFDDHLMMMHLWVKQGSSWRLAAHQTTKIP